MHHLVEQTAREVVRQEYSLRPQGRRVLWDPCEVYALLKCNMGSELIQCLALHMCDMSSPLNLEGYMKKQTTNLKFLKVYKHLDQTETKLRMSSDDTNLLSTRLRLLHWDAFPRAAFSSRFQPQNLVDVSLRSSNLRSFWTGPMGLLKLRRLDCSGSKNLELLPDLSKAVNLKELMTQGCKRLKRIPESISNLASLMKLDISCCDELIGYHITIRELTMGRCQIALYFSGKEMEMESIEYLAIGGNIYIQMFCLDGKADELCFSSELHTPHNKPMFLGLDQPAPKFSTKTSHAVQAGPELHGQQNPRPLSEFHGFNSMDIRRFNYNSDGAGFLCYSLSMFPCLKVLNLINLNIEVIPHDICNLQFLEILDWSGNDFKTLPGSINQLPNLKYVSLRNCYRLKALPGLFQLETIELSGCTGLQSFLEIAHADQDWGKFRWLELWVDGCKNIQSISDQLRHLIKLSYLDLTSHDFETLPSSIGELTSLRTLCLNKCKKLKSIKGVPLSLKHLYAHGCETLETVSLPLNHSLKHLDLSHCFCLKQDEQLITKFLNEGENEEESPRFGCFPGTKMPNYFGSPEMGKYITIDEHLMWPCTKKLGFDACIMIACERPFHLQFPPLSYNWSWEVDGFFQLDLTPDFFIPHESSFHTTAEEVAIKSDHLIIFHALENLDGNRRFWFKPNLQFSEEFKSPPAKVKSCGIRAIWEDVSADENDLELASYLEYPYKYT